jgi:predicted AAA+ superfamily ATPase
MTRNKEASTVYHQKKLTLPCLALDGMKVFATTADQRFLTVEPTDFLRTHFPIYLQSYHAGTTTTITEGDLLQRLLKPDATVIGNRVIILYGAAGSGKSELLRWLQTQISLQDRSRAEVMTRISRTNLDVFHIVQLLQQQYNIQSFQPTTQQRWEECRQKPRTLAKILVLTALEQLFYSDDQINAVYYQLIDIVQTNLEHCFAAMSQTSEMIGTSIELFSREDLDEILRSSVIPISIEYETLRFYLLKAFRDQLLEGLDLPQLLKRIAQEVQQERQQRPILLIDDLVQSINLFATDLLDYFITLEEGCWDIIIGITPNSLESTQRGKDLLNHITFLDTIDDRVEKLWLSDEYGLSSSFLNETNCAEYARIYLSEYKRQNRQPCNTNCSVFHRCSRLEPDRSDNLLAPFNEEILVRLFRSLPPGKGKVRYFTLYLRDILERIMQGEDILTVLNHYIRSELAVYHTDQELAQIYELYGPLLPIDTARESQNISNIYTFFEMQIDEADAEQPVVATLYRVPTSEQSSQQQPDATSAIDTDKEAIKAWLRGETVNKQQLRNVRRGIIKSIKDGYFLDTMTRLHIARPSRILRWAQTRLDTIPPVSLEGVDDFEGLSIDRTVGPLAYILHDFADAAGWVEQELRSQLLNHQAFPTIFFRAIAYRRSIRSTLEGQLGMKIEELAFALFIVASRLNRTPVELPPSIYQKIESPQTLPVRYPERIETERPRLSGSYVGMIRRLFEDCFKLRENVYDGLLLEEIAEAITPERALALLQNIDTNNLSVDFRLNEEPLRTLLATVQNEIATLARLKENPKVKAVLVSICQASLHIDEPSQQLAVLLGTSGSVKQRIDNFLNRCNLLELHQALCLAYYIDIAQYEHSLTLLRQALTELEEQANQSDIVSSLHKHFMREEVDMLIQFTQHDFRISINQLNTTFLTKVAEQFPDLYQRLELRLQRG